MRDSSGLETADGVSYLASCPEGECIVSMVVFDNVLYVATDKHIYKLVDDRRLDLVEDMGE